MGTARVMGREPMPWQAETLERAFEVDENGRLWYDEVVVVVPRQQGKTTLVIPWGVHRCVTWPERQNVVYTAQTRQKALEKLVEDQFYWIAKSPFRRMLAPTRRGKIEVSLTHGAEHMRWLNGSRWAIDAPTEEAGHGGTLHLTVGDEVFSLRDNRLEAAFGPTTATVDDAQSLWVSTVGRSKTRSPFLWEKVELGRNRVELARLDPSYLTKHRSLYVEYSAPDEADWQDPRTWWETMPALGYILTQAKVAGFADTMAANDGAQFRRAFLNQWRDDITEDDWRIPRSKWELQSDPTSSITGPLVWVVDVTPERTWASIAVAGLRADDRWHIEVVEDAPGTHWLIDGDPTAGLQGLKRLVARNPGPVWYDHVTTGTLSPDMDKAGIEAKPVPAQDIMVAAPGLLDGILNRVVFHIGQAELDEQLAAAVTAPFGDGWKWSRGRSMRPITALVATSLALRMLQRMLPDILHDPMDSLRESAAQEVAR